MLVVEQEVTLFKIDIVFEQTIRLVKEQTQILVFHAQLP